MQGNLYIISAPSGAGKSSLIDALLNRFNLDDKLRLSISHTTRKPRPGEVDHVHYHFVTKDEFQVIIDRQGFYEYASVFDNFYGTSREIVEQWTAEGHDVLFDIDWQGARQIKKINPDATGIFILPPSLSELRARLEKRGQDSEEVINKRMQQALAEISHYTEYDYVIVNDDFDQSLLQLRSIIIAGRHTLQNQSELIQSLFPSEL
ncbi:MAG: guanylate kinase [Succinivibrio sp.]|nr:guanylate kinase [Succinivibrio sp.]